MNLLDLGWNDTLEAAMAPHRAAGLEPARVVREDRILTVDGPAGELLATPTGRLRHEATSRAALPAVGDWVAVAARPAEGAATVHAVLPRRSRFSRQEAGQATDEQTLAANIDTAVLVVGLDYDFNVRRVERYVTLFYDSGAAPLVILNKADLCDDVDEAVAEVEDAAVGVPVLAMSASSGAGLEGFAPHLVARRTLALFGSSGVGKSTILNALLDESRQAVQAVRDHDSHGRHTTTARQIFVLPGGALVIDTPGLREVALWASEDALAGSFDDIDSLAAGCRYRDCRHQSEPGCAVRAAVEAGALDAGRLESYHKLGRELARLARRQAERERIVERRALRRTYRKGDPS